MSEFGIFFSSEESAALQPPAGFVDARVHFGSFSERVFCDTSIWSPEQYLSHWRLTAERCVQGEDAVVFCSSLDKQNAAVWPGIRAGNDMRFFMFLTPRRYLRVEKLSLTSVLPFREFLGDLLSNASQWNVPMADLERFAGGHTKGRT